MPASAGPLPTGLQASIVAFSIRFRGVVLTLGLMLLAYGAASLLHANYDVFPEFAPPQVSIQTEAPGLTPEQVELLVTTPIEVLINGVPGIQRLFSTSIQGLSVVNVIFQPASSIHLDRQAVAERLAVAAQQLPQGVKSPTMTPLTSSTGLVLVAGLTSDKHTVMDLKDIAQWTVRPRLLAVPGVANVSIFGRDTPSLQIQVKSDQLARYQLGLNDVLAVASKATGIRGAGFIDTSNQRVVVQSEGQSLTPRQLAQTVLRSEGAARVTLGDVANIVVAPEPPIGAATVNGTHGVVVNVEEQFRASTIDVTRGVKAALEELAPGLTAQGITLDTRIFRPADFIHTAMGNVRMSLYIGGTLVMLVLALFLFDLRTAAISIATIPLSLISAIVVLGWFGGSINTMTLGGLAIAIGVVVDDAVIDVENIVRRLRENKQLAEPRPTAAVILDAALEVRSPVVYATLAVLLVFAPILFLPGLSGALFGPLAMSYILAVLASLVAALTIVPALSMMLLTRRLDTIPPVVRWSRAHYEAMLHLISTRPRAVILSAATLTLAACATLPLFAASLVPEINEGHLIVHMSALSGTSIDQSLQLGVHVTNELRKIPGIRSIAQRVGRAELSGDTNGTHYSEFEVDLRAGLSGDEQEQVQADMRRALAHFVGVNFSIKSFLRERIDETLSGYSAAVAVNIFGNDLDALDRSAQQVAQVLTEAPGVSEVANQSPPGLPQLTIRLRRPALVRWGFAPTDVLDALRTAYAGDTVGQTYQGSQILNVIMLLDSKDRRILTEVGALTLRAPDGTLVPLRQIADIQQTTGRYQILHQGGRRMASVTFNIAGAASKAVAAARELVASTIKLPTGSYIQFAGSAEGQAEARANLLFNSMLAGLGIVLLLSFITQNVRNLGLVLVNLPFALAGGVLAVFGTGGFLTLGSMIGFVTVFGITVRNSVLMISHYEYLVAVEGRAWGLATAISGAGDRLTPILMTSLVTGLGLLPLAIGGSIPGQEIEGPMAIVILGGLLSSMVLNLIVLPTLALRYGRFEPTRDEYVSLSQAEAASPPTRVQRVPGRGP